MAKPAPWQVVLKDRLPAYITWERFEQNLKQLEANNNACLGVVRHGPSLLSGLVICGRCGLRMATHYSNNGQGLRYVCSRMAVDYAEPLCQSLKGRPLDDLVSELVLQALQPAALEISLQVAQDLEAERQKLHHHWRQRLERAHYEVERAARQYQAVEPEHRLVARTLERQWEQALAAEAALQGEYEQFLTQQPATLSVSEHEAIRRLAADIPTLWRAASTTAADRQAIVRQLVERVVVTVPGETEKVNVQVHWFGGHGTQTTLIRPVARLEQLSYYPQRAARVAALHAQGHLPSAIAKILNAEGWRPAKRRATFTSAMVGDLLARQGLRCLPLPLPSPAVTRAADEWLLQELAFKLGMPPPTLYRWLQQGQLQGRRATCAGRSIWLIWADAAELERLRALRIKPRTWQRPSSASENVLDS